MTKRAAIIATGRRYAIGWYDNWYVIWNVSEPGKPVAYEESRNPEGWKILAERFLQLESIDLLGFDPSDGIDTTDVGQPVTRARQAITKARQAIAKARQPVTVTFPASRSDGSKSTKSQEPNSLATVGGVLGIIGVLTSLVPFIGIGFGFLFGILAIIFSGMGLSKSDRVGTGKGIAITGLVLGILTIFFKIIPGINLL